MLKDFNLIVTTSRGNEKAVCSEVWYLFWELGDKDPHADTTGVTGLITAKTSFTPFDAIKKLRRMLRDRPHEFRFTLRVIPIQKVVETDPDEIAEAVEELGKAIYEGETFRVTVEKRHSPIDRETIIAATAPRIKRKVKLIDPDKTILIEVIGRKTGVSVLGLDDILSVDKEKIIE
ncbi:MAG: THUMP domain-containing protein [Candidatus Bathyarchaeota archaeon]|nr:MAG: THUMP domain-containing protein [Candidatus Bathyarchaeota archaeon]